MQMAVERKNRRWMDGQMRTDIISSPSKYNYTETEDSPLLSQSVGQSHEV